MKYIINLIPVRLLSFFYFFLIIHPYNIQAQIALRDSSFNSTGLLAGYFTTAVLQDDGKVLLQYSTHDDYVVIDTNHFRRLGTNGLPDSSFSDPVLPTVYRDYPQKKIKIAANGKIYFFTSAFHQYELYRLRSNGTRDSLFGINGKVSIPFDPDTIGIGSLELQHDGKIILAGAKRYGETGQNNSFFIARLNADGSIDNSFGSSGITTTDFNIRVDDPLNSYMYNNYAVIRSIQLQPDGKIIAAGAVSIWLNGYSNDSIAMARYTVDGKLDSSFNETGKLTLLPQIPVYQQQFSGATAWQVLIQPDNKIVVAASTYSQPSHGVWFNSILTIVRFSATGQLDNQFGEGGIAAGGIAPYSFPISIKLQGDGKLFVCGTNGTGRDAEMFNEVMFLRLNNNGSQDNSFGNNGVSVLPVFDNSNFYYVHENFSFCDLSYNRIFLMAIHADTTGLWAFKTDGVPLAPLQISICPNSSNQLIAGIQGSAYQWQQSNDGTNFSNLNDDASFDGVNSATLTLKSIAATDKGKQFRCLTPTASGNIITIHILQSNEAEWTGAENEHWENPANWICYQVPTQTSHVIIKKGTVKISSSTTIKSLYAGPAANIEILNGETLQVLEQVQH